MLGFISLIFLNIHSIQINLNDSILSDTTAAVIDTIDSTSLMNDSFVIEEIKEAPIKIISFRVNSNQIYELSEENNIKINERDTLSLVLQINDKSENIIFNYYFNENPNFRIIENGKILFDKTSRRIYFDFIPNNDQAINKFLTWNVFVNSEFNNLFRYDLLIEINNLEYPPRIVNKQIDKIIREKYNFNYSPIISDGGKNLIFDLQTNAPIDYFNPISGQIDWKIDPNNIKELEKIFEFKLSFEAV